MDKVEKIIAAALVAASMSQATPALSAVTTAEEFVQGLSADFTASNYASIRAKLDGLNRQGFEGVRVDDVMAGESVRSSLISIARLVELLSEVQANRLDSRAVAAALQRAIEGAENVVFLAGSYQATYADPEGTGTVFPAGSAA
jgi:hypothetical protein